ncbi:DUF4124 domain-containing protein [Hydrogenophaga sp. YM1]|uniref:DUF4124 domain-containing protein n=1 Tax=Hydrogenophaga sp. YM1 TaxID=2806262 RepID=UPI00195B165C|nr:DUF4124 domain-containing protein [Hydrogenophaga sp. YM1]QRR35611.1 DUF4124 domain-containing protein [Hydrogenophaga sp. YM1]
MRLRLLLAILMLAPALSSHAQKLPAPSRDVYRCAVGGKVTYSDAPCLGAKKVDVEPTRGLNATSGNELVGADVQRERRREQFTEAVRPITGMDSKQLDTQAKRTKLSAASRRECQDLDQAIPAAESQERAASGEAMKSVQLRLLSLRKRFISVGC